LTAAAADDTDAHLRLAADAFMVEEPDVVAGTRGSVPGRGTR
jgi:hypothetical protein